MATEALCSFVALTFYCPIILSNFEAAFVALGSGRGAGLTEHCCGWLAQEM